jgi:uncharacterized membrane protein YhhN
MMKKEKRAQFAIYFFYGNAIINLLAQIVKIDVIDYITKPLIMSSLLIYYLAGRKEKANTLTSLMIAAIFFSWCGDIILMLQGSNEKLFVFGLASFLIAHLFYIPAYGKAVNQDKSEVNQSFIRTRIAFLLFVGLALIYILYPRLEEMLIPVSLYTIVIITMAIAAVMRKGRTIDKSFIMVYSGALLFIMSDSMIAINKFLNPLVQARLLIMATYIAAQLLIVKGILMHENATAKPAE